MSVANFSFSGVTYLAGSAQSTLVPAVPLNTLVGTSLVVLKRAVTFTEIVFSLPAGLYDMNANLTLNIDNAETAVQQIELQIVTLVAAGGNVLNIFASNTFCATRNPPNATFAAVDDIAYHLQCSHNNINVVAGQNYGIRCLINGNPVGGSLISDATFAVTKTGDNNLPLIFVA